MGLVLSACNPARGPDRDLPERYRAMPVPVERLASSGARERGRDLYLHTCAICHGVRGDGRGERQMGLSSSPRNFTDRGWRRGTTPRRIFSTVREGIERTPMPAFRALSDDETWDLVAYVLSLGEAGR